MKKINLTFMGIVNGIEQITKHAQMLLGSRAIHLVEEEGSFAITLDDYTKFVIHIPEYVNTKEKLEGYQVAMFNHVRMIKTDKKDIQINLLKQIQLSRLIGNIQFDLTSDDSRNDFLYSVAITLMKEFQTCILMPNKDILNCNSKLILSSDGKSDLNEYKVTVNIDKLFHRTTEATEEDVKIYNNSNKILESNNVFFDANIKQTLRYQDLKIRTKEEICKRALATYAVGIYSALKLHNADDFEKVEYSMIGLENKYSITPFYSSVERAYRNTKNLIKEFPLKFIWNFEASAVLFWALGLIDELNPVNSQFKPEVLSKLLSNYNGFKDVLDASKLRSDEELFQLQDLCLRYRFACNIASSKSEFDIDVIPGVIIQRYKTLNWVVTTLYGDEWDKIDLTI